jgi:hypothetical protein
MSYRATPGPTADLLRWANRWWHRALYIVGLLTWLWLVCGSLIGQTLSDLAILRAMVGPVLLLMWYLHERTVNIESTTGRIEAKLDPLLTRYDALMTLEETVKSMLGVLRDLGSHEKATLYVFGHNMSRLREYIDAFVLVKGEMKAIELRLLVLDPRVEPTRAPVSFFRGASEVLESLRYIQGRLASQRSKMDKLGRRAHVTIKGYQTYPHIEGCRLHVPSREKSYFYVTFHAIRHDLREPSWQDKYIAASVRTNGDTLEDETCPPINFYTAELFAGLFDHVYNDQQSVTLCTLDYPAQVEFTYAEGLMGLKEGR